MGMKKNDQAGEELLGLSKNKSNLEAKTPKMLRIKHGETAQK